MSTKLPDHGASRRQFNPWRLLWATGGALLCLFQIAYLVGLRHQRVEADDALLMVQFLAALTLVGIIVHRKIKGLERTASLVVQTGDVFLAARSILHSPTDPRWWLLPSSVGLMALYICTIRVDEYGRDRSAMRGVTDEKRTA